MKKTSLLKLAAGAALACASVAGAHRLALAGYFELEKISALVASMGALGPFAFMGLCVAGVFLHVPEFVLIAAGSVLFGCARGFAYGWAGALAGSAATFLCARYFIRDAVRDSIAGRFTSIDALDRRLAARGFLTVLLLRLILFMAPPLNWAIALTSIRFTQYVAASALGIIPGVAVTCYCAGALLGAKSLSDALTPGTAAAFALLACMVAGGSLAARRIFSSDKE